jgi:hypothetical protein
MNDWGLVPGMQRFLFCLLSCPDQLWDITKPPFEWVLVVHYAGVRGLTTKSDVCGGMPVLHHTSLGHGI